MASWLKQLKPRTKVIGAIVGVLAISGIGVGVYLGRNSIFAQTSGGSARFQVLVSGIDTEFLKTHPDVRIRAQYKMSDGNIKTATKDDAKLPNQTNSEQSIWITIPDPSTVGVSASNIVSLQIQAYYASYDASGRINTNIQEISKSNLNSYFSGAQGPLISLAFSKKPSATGTQATASSDICVTINGKNVTYNKLNAGFNQWVPKGETNLNNALFDSGTANKLNGAKQANGTTPTYSYTSGACSGSSPATSTAEKKCIADHTSGANTYFWVTKQGSSWKAQNGNIYTDSDFTGADYTVASDTSCGAYTAPAAAAGADDVTQAEKKCIADHTSGANTYFWVTKQGSSWKAQNGNIYTDSDFTGADYTVASDTSCGAYTAPAAAAAPQTTNNQMTLNVSAVDGSGKPVVQAQVVTTIAANMITDYPTAGAIAIGNTDGSGKAQIVVQQSDLIKDKNTNLPITRLQIYATKDLRVLNINTPKQATAQPLEWAASNTPKDIKLVFPDITAEEAAVAATNAAQPLGGSGGNPLILTTLAGSNFPTGNAGFKIALAVPSQVEETGFTMAGGGRVTVQGCFTDAVVKAQATAVGTNKIGASVAYAAESATINITGTVRNQDGTPAANATVQIKDYVAADPSSGIIRGVQAATDKNGKFNISIPGTYQDSTMIIQAISSNSSSQVRKNIDKVTSRDIGNLTLPKTSDSGAASTGDDVAIPELGTGTGTGASGAGAVPTNGFTFIPPYSSIVQPFFKEGEDSYNATKRQGIYNRCFNFTINFPDNGKNSTVVVRGLAEGLYKFNASKSGFESTSWWAPVRGSNDDLGMLPIIPNGSTAPPSISANNIERKNQYQIGVYEAAGISKCTGQGMEAFFISEYPWYGWQCAKEDETKKIINGYVITEPNLKLSSGLYGMPVIPPNTVPRLLGMPAGLSERAAQCASSMTSTSIGIGGGKGDLLLAIAAGALTGTSVYDAQRSSGSTVDDARTNGWLTGAIAAVSVYRGGNVNVTKTQIQQCFGSLQPQVYDPCRYCQRGSTDPYCQICSLNSGLASTYLLNTNPRLLLPF